MGAALLLSAVVAATPATGDDTTYEVVVQAGETLVTGSEWEKVGAAGVLGDVPAVYAVPFLEAALGDESLSVRIMAVAALGRIAHASAAKALARAARGEDPLVAIAAIEALGEMHVDASYDALIDLLADVEDPDAKASIVAGLKKWNKPYKPLPEPKLLPKGKKPPVVPKPGSAPGPKPEPEPAHADAPPQAAKSSKQAGKCLEKNAGGKKDAKTIDMVNPYGDPGKLTTVLHPFPCLAGMIDETNPYVDPAVKPIDVDNPYSVPGAAGKIDEENPYAPPG